MTFNRKTSCSNLHILHIERFYYKSPNSIFNEINKFYSLIENNTITLYPKIIVSYYIIIP